MFLSCFWCVQEIRASTLQPFLPQCKPDPHSDLSFLGYSWATFKVCHQRQHRGKDACIVQIAKHSATTAHLFEALLVIPVCFPLPCVSNSLTYNFARCGSNAFEPAFPYAWPRHVHQTSKAWTPLLHLRFPSCKRGSKHAGVSQSLSSTSSSLSSFRSVA